MKTIEAMAVMIEEDKDISLCPDVVGVDKVNAGCIVKVGAPEKVIQMLMSGDYMFSLFIVNKKELQEIKNRESGQSNQKP